MGLQENTVFDSWFDLGIKVIRYIAQYSLYNVTFAPVKFEVVTSNGLGGDAFTRKYSFFSILPWTLGQGQTKFTQYLLDHVAYTSSKFESARFNDLGDVFTRKYIIWRLTKMLPSTLFIIK